MDQRLHTGGSSFAPFAFGIGIATLNNSGAILDTFYPKPYLHTHASLAEVLAKLVNHHHGTQFYPIDSALFSTIPSDLGEMETLFETLRDLPSDLSQKKKQLVVTFIEKHDSEPQSVPDVYLRLHLLSHRMVQPNTMNLTNIFKILPNVAWTSEGPMDLQEVPKHQLLSRLSGNNLTVYGVDKFPRMIDYVVPEGVRIADGDRVRLGAYLGSGTTVMHEGFVNFNAGCEGPNMIEGRISAGVFVKKGTDLGGGCSIMGTLSGGGSMLISVGEDCLLGANSGVGIPLGNGCTIEAGLYVTAGSIVFFEGRCVKARELAHCDDLLFRRHSQTGRIEVISKRNATQLNTVLHHN